jgi:NodT family efflux transporter outer membrane factor (OMF) lipoprotein
MARPTPFLLVSFAAASLAGCAVGPNFHRPHIEAGDGYGETATNPPQAATATLKLNSAGTLPHAWWRNFGSAKLDALVEESLQRNPTLAAARAALRSAKELQWAQWGAYLPQVSASVQPSHQYFAHTLASPTQSGRSVYDLTTSQVSVAYVFDLFGANARAVEAAKAQTDQARFELEAARQTLAANVVVAAVTDASLRQQIEETRGGVAAQRHILASAQLQHALGQMSDADLAAATAALAQAEATLPPLEKQFRVNRDLIAALVGRTPAEAPEASFTLSDFALPAELPLTLPAQLVRQRPDVRLAEAQLHYASAEVGVAVAARLPNISLDAAAGSAALKLTPDFNSPANFWSVAGTITQPIFSGGTLWRRQRAAEATLDQAKNQYRAAVIAAFQSSADALHAVWADDRAAQASETAEAATERSYAIAQRQLGLGDVSDVAVWTSEQSARQARIALIQARATRLSDVVALYQALGGGWTGDDAKSSKPNT